MADYVSREVARERLRKACKAGSIISFFLLLGGLAYGGIAAIIALNIRLPFEFMYTFLHLIVPTMADTTLALAECGTKAALLFLIGLLGMLMFRKVNKTGDSFRTGQCRQLKFIAFLAILLGFLPSVVGNALKVATAIQLGNPPMAVMSFVVEPMCIVAGLFMFMATRMLVAGSLLGHQEEEFSATSMVDQGEPDFMDVPDLAHVPTATPVPDETMARGEYGTFGVHDLDQSQDPFQEQ